MSAVSNDGMSSQDAVSAAAAEGQVVSCLGLTKIFRDFWFRNRVRAVDGIQLEVRSGEVFGLLGPNGSGKSTAIKMILGLLHPTAGRVAVFGKRPEDVSTKKRIGYLPEESYLYRFLNARETLEYYGRLFHQSRVQRQRRIDQLLDWVGLEAVQRRPVGEYSKGMQRRIGLAQALINDPDLLILDEPTTGMDPVATRQFKDLMLRLKDRGKTILLCSHLLADVEDVCDRVAVMYGGRIQREGTVDELLTQQNKTTLHADRLDAGTIDRIESLLSESGKHIEKVEQPRQKLESLFLEIVNQAQAQGAETSGAVSGGQIAAFLTQPSAANSPEGEVIEKLMERPSAEVAPQGDEASPSAATQQEIEQWSLAAPKGPDQSEAPGAAAIDKQVIEQLTSTSDRAEVPADGAADLPSSSSNVAGAPVPPSAPAATPPTESSAGGEKPDQSFIDALLDVPEVAPADKDPQEEEEKDSGESTAGRQ